MFEIRVKYDPDTNEYYFSKFHLEHKNHEVSREAYVQHPNARKLNDPEVEKYVSDHLMDLKVKSKTLVEKIRAETGKRVTRKDLNNYKTKLLLERDKRLGKITM